MYEYRPLHVTIHNRMYREPSYRLSVDIIIDSELFFFSAQKFLQDTGDTVSNVYPILNAANVLIILSKLS